MSKHTAAAIESVKQAGLVKGEGDADLLGFRARHDRHGNDAEILFTTQRASPATHETNSEQNEQEGCDQPFRASRLRT